MSDYKDDNREASEKNVAAEKVESSDYRASPAIIEKFVIRLPNGLRTKIKHLSEQNRRSMNSEIIMVLEKHIQQHMLDHAADFADSPLSLLDLEQDSENPGVQRPSNSELTKRLENLPEEKKQALLELLG